MPKPLIKIEGSESQLTRVILKLPQSKRQEAIDRIPANLKKRVEDNISRTEAKLKKLNQTTKK